MSRKSVPIPGEILRTTVVLGLTFDELVMLGSIPAVMVLPSLYIDEIPMIVSGGIILLGIVCVGALVLQTPDGQTPLEWAPARFSRYINPDEYFLKPRHSHRAQPTYLDRVVTADKLEDEYDGPESIVVDTDEQQIGVGGVTYDDSGAVLDVDIETESPVPADAPPEAQDAVETPIEDLVQDSSTADSDQPADSGESLDDDAQTDKRDSALASLGARIGLPLSKGQADSDDADATSRQETAASDADQDELTEDRSSDTDTPSESEGHLTATRNRVGDAVTSLRSAIPGQDDTASAADEDAPSDADDTNGVDS